MPELPEAETIARGLQGRIAGARVREVRVHRPELVEPAEPDAFVGSLTGRSVREVGRRGKWIVARLDDGRRWVTQLRMTGTFDWSETPDPDDAPHLSLTVAFDGRDGRLRFRDVRRFARMRVVDSKGWAEIDGRLGPEPLDPGFTTRVLSERLQGSRAPIRNALLDQGRIAGLGNVYANEACFSAGIDPRRPAATLSESELTALHEAIRATLARAIERRGTSFSDFRDLSGATGGFQNELAVYDREGRPCTRCDTPIVRHPLAGRSAFLCPTCQG